METISDRNARLVREYLSWLKNQKRARGVTLYNYASALEKYLADIGDTPLEDVSTQRMEAWMQRPRAGRAHGTVGSASTLQKEVAILRAAYKYLHAAGRISRNPTLLLVAPKVHNRQPKAIPDELWSRVWGCTALSDDARVVLGLGFFGGLRRREIMAVGPHHFFPAAEKLVAFMRKGGDEDALPYGELLSVFEEQLPHLIPGGREGFIEPLHRMIDERRGRSHLIPWADKSPTTDWAAHVHEVAEGMADPHRLYKRMPKWLALAGVPRNAFTPHALRHSFATNLLRAGLPLPMVSNLANHTSVQVTMRYLKLGGNELGEWRSTHQQPTLKRGIDRLN